VLSQQPGAISPPFLKTCIRVSAGSEQVAIKKTEERSGMQITTGTLQNGGELVLYKTLPAGEIRGFVISFPSSGPAADAKK
jgi:HD-like signal output (HDOD) protein